MLMNDKLQYDKELLSNKVIEYLKKQILMGEYSSGDHISEPKIAKKLEVSRAPVREAILYLERQGIIKCIPRRGSFVVEFNEKDIKEIYEIRIILEEKVLETLIVERLLTTKDYSSLEDLAKEMLDISTNDNLPLKEKMFLFMEKDIKFHKHLWKKSKRRLSYRILKNNYFQLQLAMVHDYHLDPDLESTAKNHFAILENLKNRDLKGCREALIEHIKVYYNNNLPK